MTQWQQREKQRWLEEQGRLERRAKVGRAASAGMEAMERGKEGGAEEGPSGSGTSVNLNMGGWSVRREEENHMLLYIWILNGERRG